jgi:hypothetical protein
MNILWYRISFVLCLVGFAVLFSSIWPLAIAFGAVSVAITWTVSREARERRRAIRRFRAIMRRL